MKRKWFTFDVVDSEGIWGKMVGNYVSHAQAVSKIRAQLESEVMFGSLRKGYRLRRSTLKPRSPFADLDPDVFEAAAEYIENRHCVCCCWALASCGDRKHRDAFSSMFEPKGRLAAFWMEYEDPSLPCSERRQLPIPQVKERRILAMLLCAEFTRDAR